MGNVDTDRKRLSRCLRWSQQLRAAKKNSSKDQKGDVTQGTLEKISQQTTDLRIGTPVGSQRKPNATSF